MVRSVLDHYHERVTGLFVNCARGFCQTVCTGHIVIGEVCILPEIRQKGRARCKARVFQAVLISRYGIDHFGSGQQMRL